MMKSQKVNCVHWGKEMKERQIRGEIKNYLVFGFINEILKLFGNLIHAFNCAGRGNAPQQM